MKTIVRISIILFIALIAFGCSSDDNQIQPEDQTPSLNIPNDPAIPNASFSKRTNHTVTQFKGKLWLIGGFSEDGLQTDIYDSDNGVDWVYRDRDLQTPLDSHSTVVFNDTLWVLGGRSTIASIGGLSNLMLGSVDGQNFTFDYTAPWSSRRLHTATVFNNKLWVLGGIDDNLGPLNNVWYTSNVSNWDVNSYSPANWSGRYGHTAIVFNNKLWVIGGYDGGGNGFLNDVWYTDGTTNSSGEIHWEFVEQLNEFPARYLHQTVVLDNKIWLVGGRDSNGWKNDIWYTEDGANWVSLIPNANFPERGGHTLTVFNEKMYLIGGDDGSLLFNDVWLFD